MPLSKCQCSDVWGLEPRWASLGTVISAEWGSMTLPGVSAVVRLIVSSLPGSPSLGLMETPQVGYLVIIPIFQHIQVE